MKSTTSTFKENVHSELQNEKLKQVFGGILLVLPLGRAMAKANLPEFDALRDQARDIKNHTLENLDFYLEAFEAKVLEQGGQVHWCETHEEARDVVLKICQDVGAKTVTKGKSMITEEMGLNDYLETHGIQPIETDMGEYIIQLAGETPSHLIGPAFHKTKEDVTELFYEHHKTQRWTEGEDLMAEGRKVLREKYFAADVGITGANFLIAETGSTVIVTNEGNGDLTQTLPKVHVVCASIEKVVPTLEDFSQLIRVLPRSATGQEITAYTTLSTGPKRQGDLDGPAEFHVVLVDAGRSKYLGTEVQEILRCIRCSACLNHCPIYSSIGGHAYGWVYQGPLGAALDPLLLGTKEAAHLPNASTLCGRCEAVCPVRIPIPKILRHWRTEAHKEGFGTTGERSGLAFWAFCARHPQLYRLGSAWAIKLLGALGAKRGAFRSLPFLSGWTLSRDMPAPEGETFMAAWKKAQKKGARA